jgi:hypothetical protein
MKTNAEIHLVIPGVCGPVAELHTLQSSAEVKKWIALLSKAALSKTAVSKAALSKATLAEAACSPSQESSYDVLSAITGIECDNDFPSAAFTLLARDDHNDNSRHYMYADPVHLQADLDHAILTSSVDLNISESESSDLCAILNQHFEQDGLNFERLNKDEWLLSSPNKIEMTTTPLSQAVARNVNFILPKGKGSDYWKKILTEAQMLMYSSDVNSVRESNGEQSINSLWFYGSGELPELNKTINVAKVSSICSNDVVLKGMAKHINSDYIPIPSSASDYIDYLLNNHRGRASLFHLAELEHLINYTDTNIWLEKLTELLEAWVYPLIKLAAKNNIKVVLYPCDNKQYHFLKYDAMKFWRKAQLDNYISVY